MHKVKERLANMEKRRLIIACIAVVVLTAAIIAAVMVFASSTQSPPASTKDIMVSGEMVCLPHKNTDGEQTLECAYGLRADDNRFYGLRYQPFPNDIKIGQRVTVKGILDTTADDKYNIAGTIQVTAFEKP